VLFLLLVVYLHGGLCAWDPCVPVCRARSWRVGCWLSCLLCFCTVVSVRGTHASLSAVRGVDVLGVVLVAVGTDVAGQEKEHVFSSRTGRLSGPHGQHGAFVLFLCPVIVLESYCISPQLMTYGRVLSLFPLTVLVRSP